MEDFIAGLIGFIVIIAIVCALVAFPVMWLWNWLMPMIFGLVEINFAQALGLSLLCSFLFKPFTNGKN